MIIFTTSHALLDLEGVTDVANDCCVAAVFIPPRRASSSDKLGNPLGFAGGVTGISRAVSTGSVMVIGGGVAIGIATGFIIVGGGVKGTVGNVFNTLDGTAGKELVTRG